MNVPNWKMRFIDGNSKTQNTRAEKEEAYFISFIAHVVRPAFAEIGRRLGETGRTVSVLETRAACGLTVKNGGSDEITFRVMSRSMPSAIIPIIEVKMRERRGLRFKKNIFPLRSPFEERSSLAETTVEDIVECFFQHYQEALGNLE